VRLPEWLGNLTSLEKISIKDCPAVTYLPGSIKSLPALRALWLTECDGLNVFYGKPGLTHNPDKPLLTSVNNLRIVSTNRYSRNIDTITTHK
jgi:hypothetical protein